MKAHDIRKMTVCEGCGSIGMRNPFLNDACPALIVTPSGRLLHPLCISEALLLKCAETELITIRVPDVGRELFEPIAAEVMRRRGM